MSKYAVKLDPADQKGGGSVLFESVFLRENCEALKYVPKYHTNSTIN